MKEWVSLHQHTDESNAGGYFEVVTQYQDYVNYAKDNNLSAVCITNHGNVARWMKHKMAIEDAGMKYIHGIEAYVTMNLEDKNRGYHTILIAKNYEGVKEINKLSSASFNRQDGHFYYKPRILFEDLANTSDNIFITTACLAGALWQNYPHLDHQNGKQVDGNKDYFNQWLQFIQKNRERVYLELQPHLDEDQKVYNKLLLELSEKYQLKLIAANDIHALNTRHNDIRLMIKNGKKSAYEGDDKFELWCKNYDEMKETFARQGVVSEDKVEQALDATMEIVDQIEEFKLDRSHKYPHLFKDEEGKFKELILQGLKDRGITKLNKEQRQIYLNRINHEYKVYKHNGAISYMLADWLMVKEAKKQGRHVGYARGSCLIGDTHILMADYTEKPIKDVKVGDYVFTHLGNKRRVTNTFVKNANKIVTTKFAGGMPISSTPNHRFFVRKRGERVNEKAAYPVESKPHWCASGGLRNSDLITMLRPTFDDRKFPIIDLSQYGEGNMKYDDTYVWNEIGSNHIVQSKIGRYIDTGSEDIAWLIGTFIGNGWTVIKQYENSKRFSFGVCFHSKHREKIEKADKILKSLGLNTRRFKGYEGKKVVQITGNNMFFSKWMESIIGHLAENKHIPEFYFSRHDDLILRSLIRGMLMTDGHISKTTPKWSYSSINVTLIEQLSLIMMHLGFYGNIRKYHRKEEGWHDEFCIQFSGGQLYRMNDFFGFNGATSSRNNRFKQDNNYYYGKVRDMPIIHELSKPTSVYDLEVEGDHSYIANHAIVHNCSGSLIAYLLHSTEMDSVKHGLNFERFMNPERISLADIDHDFSGNDKIQVQEWLLTNPKLHCASIMTANTYGLKGAIKVIAKGMDGYKDKSPFEIQGICNQIDIKDQYPDVLYQKHKELIDTAKEIIGVIDSFGRHACGIVVSTDPIDDVMGTQTVSGWDYPVTQVYMKEIDYCNFTKFDVLGLDNLGLITKACELAGLPFLTPDSSDIIDFQDEKVWMSMTESNIGIFQFEGERAGSILRHLFSEKTLSRIKERVPNIQFVDLLSLANAAQRPSGASYLEAVTEGQFTDNGHKALNDFLAPTLGNLVYQEQLIEFLVKFCGWDYGHGDLIRRGIGKKDKNIMDKEVPKIKPAFLNTMIEEYGDTEEHANEVADRFIQVFMDAVNYGFSINHSMAYSYIGYIATWLRYYYPLEFCTAAFSIWGDDQSKINKVSKYAKAHGIKLEQAKYGKSKGRYFMDKDNNTIYEGTEPIKGNNAQVGDDLYNISTMSNYKNFTELLLKISDDSYLLTQNGKHIDIKDIYRITDKDKLKTLDKKLKSGEISLVQNKYNINRTKMESLIKLDFFSDFGKAKKLQLVYDFFQKNYKPKNKTLSGKAEKYRLCCTFENETKNEDYLFMQRLEHELYYTGKCSVKNEAMPAKYGFIISLDKGRTRTRATVYSLKFGKEMSVLIGNRVYKDVPFKEGDLISIIESEEKPKSVYIDGTWTKHPTDKDLWLKQIKFIRKGEM